MKHFLSITVDFFSRETRKLFLIDALGAAVTSFSLFFVLRNYNEYFGMPQNSLTYMSILGLFYFTYSISCFYFVTNRFILCLRIIAIANILYSTLTIILLYVHYNDLTKIGLAYFLSETLIIAVLAYVEFRVASILKNQSIKLTN
jgi:hypothetical protein